MALIAEELNKPWQSPAGLSIQGAPPLTESLRLATALADSYQGHKFLEWHPVRQEMLVLHRPASAPGPQLYLVSEPLAAPKLLTREGQRIRSATWEPQSGRYVVVQVDNESQEITQLQKLNPSTGEVLPLPTLGGAEKMQGWLRQQKLLMLISTIGADPKGIPTSVLWTLNPEQPQSLRRILELPGDGWQVTATAKDERRVVLTQTDASGVRGTVMLHMPSGRRASPTWPSVRRPQKSGIEVRAHAGGQRWWVQTTEQDGIRRIRLMHEFSATEPKLSGLAVEDVVDSSLSADGKQLAVRRNVHGRFHLQLLDTSSLQTMPTGGDIDGSVQAARFHPQQPLLAMAVTSRQLGPSAIFSLNVTTGKMQQWTRVRQEDGAPDLSVLKEPSLLEWRSFDGQQLYAWLSEPSTTRRSAPKPVLIHLSGGPYRQALMGHLGLFNYVVEELGMVLIQPNLRGTQGRGQRFMDLDNGRSREDVVKDLQSLVQWVKRQPGLDSQKIFISGGGYGGFVALLAAATFPNDLAGVIALSPYIHLPSAVTNGSPSTLNSRRAEFGDERVAADKLHMEQISPMARASQVRTPLLITQGNEDPLVPKPMMEEFLRTVRANGLPAWYLLSDREKHGFEDPANVHNRFGTMVQFLRDAR